MKKTTKKPIYQATLKILRETFTSKGETPLQAVLNLNPGNCKGRSFLKIEGPDLTIEKMISPRLIFQIFNGSRTMREIGIKNLNTLFGI